MDFDIGRILTPENFAMGISCYLLFTVKKSLDRNTKALDRLMIFILGKKALKEFDLLEEGENNE